MTTLKKGRIIVFEGLDKSGKTTQATLLAHHLGAKLVKFPDRQEPATGFQIDQYLKGKLNLTPQTSHLLFIANRYQVMKQVEQDLQKGIDIILDRYSYSGTAYAMARGISKEWAQTCENGLPEPDLVLCFLPRQEKIVEITMDLKNETDREITETVPFQIKVMNNFQNMSESKEIIPRAKKWINVEFCRKPENTSEEIIKDILRTHHVILKLIDGSDQGHIHVDICNAKYCNGHAVLVQ